MSKDDVNLLSKFVLSFAEDGGDPLDEGDLVIHQTTDPSALGAIYTVIPIRFPSLLEKLLLSYRWYGADTGLFRIFPNLPGEDLSEFLSNMRKD